IKKRQKIFDAARRIFTGEDTKMSVQELAGLQAQIATLIAAQAEQQRTITALRNNLH
ncbi:hypothetical protein EVAR_72961_1, partial [Eumeta japonica]